MLSSRLCLTACVASLAAVLSVPAANGVSSAPVLGKWRLTGRYSIGWGTAQPHLIFNGGDPSGKAWNLRWAGWGSGSATAYGRTWVFRPNGGYFAKPGEIELRAYRLGRCTAGGPPAYTRLSVRVARPGGTLGRWYAWGGWHTTCRFPS